MHSIKAGSRTLSPQVMFADGAEVRGPDQMGMTSRLSRMRCVTPGGFNAPVIVHVVTRKGMGYAPAENDAAEQMHSCGVIDPRTGLATKSVSPGWTSIFSESLIRYAAKRRDVVAITAAMPGPTGLSAFGRRFDRLFDASASPSSTL